MKKITLTIFATIFSCSIFSSNAYNAGLNGGYDMVKISNVAVGFPNKMETDRHLIIYPNPAVYNQVVYVELPQIVNLNKDKVKFTLKNLTGQTVIVKYIKIEDNSFQLILNDPSLTSGFYIVTIEFNLEVYNSILLIYSQ